MMDDNFLKLLKDTAKEQSSLKREKFVPDQLSSLSDFVATHLWQSILSMSLLSAVLLNLYQLGIGTK